MTERSSPGRGASPAPEIATLQSALTVREHLGFRRASEVLGVNPSVLSRRVQALEDLLGVSLFQRTAGGARPTAAGERFLAEVERVLGLLQRAAARAATAGDVTAQRLRIGHTWPIAAGPVERLLRLYRSEVAGIELQLCDGPAVDLAAAVADGELDIAFMSVEDVPPNLERLTLWSEPWLLAQPADLEFGAQRLSGGPVLCTAEDDPAQIRRLAAVATGGPATVRPQMTSHEGVLSLVAVGAGLALVPQSVARSTRADVRFSPLPKASDRLRGCAAWRGDDQTAALRRFLAVMHRFAAECDHDGSARGDSAASVRFAMSEEAGGAG